MRVIPGMTVISPSDAVSAEKLIEQAAAIDGPFYIRLGRSGVPVIYNENKNEIKIGKATFLRKGKDITVIAAGIMVEKALEAAEILRGKGIDATVLDMHTIKPSGYCWSFRQRKDYDCKSPCKILGCDGWMHHNWRCRL